MPRVYNIPSWQLQGVSDQKASESIREIEDVYSGEYMEYPVDGEAIQFSYEGKLCSGVVVGEVFMEESQGEKAITIQHTDSKYGCKKPYVYALSVLDYQGRLEGVQSESIRRLSDLHPETHLTFTDTMGEVCSGQVKNVEGGNFTILRTDATSSCKTSTHSWYNTGPKREDYRPHYSTLGDKTE